MYRVIILLLVIIGCRSSPEKSFNKLSSAFIDWYFKYHPIESIRYGEQESNGNIRLYDISARNEYHADISRFIIELSQIDPTKLSLDNQLDYMKK